MRLLVFNHIQNAYQSLRANRLRTILTMLGITIGVASITSILALSTGATDLVRQQVEELGGNIVVIRPGTDSSGSLGELAIPAAQRNAATSTLTENDLTAVESLPGVEVAAPIMLINGSLAANGNRIDSATVVATTPGLIDISNIEIGIGQFIDGVTSRNAAVIGAQASIDLFGTDQSIGHTFTVRGKTFTIVGVLEPQNNPVNFNAVDFDNSVIISLDSGKTFYRNVAHIQQINTRVSAAAELQPILDSMTSALVQSHQGEHDFTILSGEQISQPTNRLFDAIAGAAAAIAGISLVVGGIGIMNIMLVNVAERTREIGIRKALGASNSQITWQFMIESLALGLGGGLGGYLGGYALAFAISVFLPFQPSFTWEIALVALAVSLIVGVIFGLYPAARAARKDPIESLRHYT